MALNWTDMEDAIFSWVSTVTEYADSQIIWEHYSQPRPEGAFISLFMDGPTRLGVDYVTYETNLSNPAGEEITETITGVRDLTVRITCYGGSPTEATNPVAVATSLMAGLRLSGVAMVLNDAGLFWHGDTSITSVPAIIAADFEPRAVLEQPFYVKDTLAQSSGYIATVSGTGQITDEEDIYFITT